MTFEKLGLRAELLRALAAGGYKNPTPVQAQAIPEVLDGRDILAGAQTGTGKTAAFALPILHNLSQQKTTRNAKARALVLTPTRELAVQVSESFRTYGKHLRLKTVVVYGGVGFNPQVDRLARGADIIVATPGRLLDHANQRTVDLSGVEMLVLDEGDRMLDMGFIHDIRRIMSLLPAKRQNMLFSATYSREVRRLAEGVLNNPCEIEVAARNTAAERVAQIVHPVSQSRKRELLAHLIAKDDWRQVLVFTRTKNGANRLAVQLDKNGIKATAIHGDKTQSARMKALNDFKAGHVRVLVATDVASRGIDIDHLPHVVNYDMPNVPEDYVHRIGRTGRAGKEGTAVSLVSSLEDAQLRDIEKLIGKSIDSVVVEGFEGERLARAGYDPTVPVKPHAPGTRRLGAKGSKGFPRPNAGRRRGPQAW